MRNIKAALIPMLALLVPWAAWAAPPTPQPVAEITQFRDWTLACDPLNRSQCLIRQVLVDPQTQATIMTILIGHSVNIRTNPVIVFNLPATANSKELVTLKVDKSDQLAVPDIRCNSQICSAIANFTPDIAGQFQKGSKVAVTFPDKAQRIGLTVSLSGFASAYKALVTQHGS